MSAGLAYNPSVYSADSSRHLGRLVAMTVVVSLSLWLALHAGASPQPFPIPYERLAPWSRAEVAGIVASASLTAEKTGITFQGNPAVYEHLLNHLPFTSDVARILGLSEYTVNKGLAGAFEAGGPRGGRATFWIVFADPAHRVVLAHGRHGRVVLVLRYGSTTNGNGDTIIHNDLYGYAKIHNPILRFFVKIFGGGFGGRVDDIFAAAARLCEEASRDPVGLYNTLVRSEDIAREPLKEFTDLLHAVAKRPLARLSAAEGDEP